MMNAGRYKAVAQEAELGESGNGTEQVWVLFRITEPGEHEGDEISWYGYFKSDASIRIALGGLRAAGWTGNDISDLSSLCPSETECSLVIKHETYEGETRARVAFVNELGRGGGQANPMDEGKKKKFAATLNARLKEFEGNGKDTRDMDDDVPFNVT